MEWKGIQVLVASPNLINNIVSCKCNINDNVKVKVEQDIKNFNVEENHEIKKIRKETNTTYENQWKIFWKVLKKTYKILWGYTMRNKYIGREESGTKRDMYQAIDTKDLEKYI